MSDPKMRPVYAMCPIHGNYVIGVIDPRDLSSYRSVSNGCPKCDEERLRQAEQARWNDVAIPLRFKNARIERVIAKTPAQIAVRDAVKAYGDILSSGNIPSCGLVMTGRAGTGKTLLAASLAILAREAGHSSRFAVMSKLLRSVAATWGRSSEETEAQVIEKYADVDFLVIDEVARMKSEAINEIFFAVVNERYERMKPTVITTNASQEALADFLEPRVVRRILAGDGLVLNFDWEPYRGDK